MITETMNLHFVTAIKISPLSGPYAGAMAQKVSFRRKDGTEIEITAFLEDDAQHVCPTCKEAT